jgi:hypothetical protein
LPEPYSLKALVARRERRLADAGVVRADFVAFSGGAEHGNRSTSPRLE